MKAFYVALTPWLAFIVADRSAGLGPAGAALVGLIVALGIVGFELRCKRLRALPIVAFAEFSALATLAVKTGGTDGIWRYDRALAIAILAALFLASSFAAPLTAPYVRDIVTPRHWTERSFARANAALTRWWSLVFALVAASFVLGATFERPLPTTVFNWLVPIAIIAVAATRFSVASDGDRGALALNALDCLMSDARDSEWAGDHPRRLNW
jgi:hypothetical protein